MSEFVKLGHDSGWVEVELKGKPGGRNFVIRRHLANDSDRTTFTLDGRDATAAEIHQTMARLNVQVGNLCTFLPQDRVSSFSQMAPNELLKETQRAAGDARLTKWHDWLVDAHKYQKETKDELDRKLGALRHKQEKQVQQEREVRQFQDRRMLQRQLDVLSLLVPFAEYAQYRDDWAKSKELRNQAKQDLKQLELANLPFKNAQESVTSVALLGHCPAGAGGADQQGEGVLQGPQGQGPVLREVEKGLESQGGQDQEGTLQPPPRD